MVRLRLGKEGVVVVDVSVHRCRIKRQPRDRVRHPRLGWVIKIAQLEVLKIKLLFEFKTFTKGS